MLEIWFIFVQKLFLIEEFIQQKHKSYNQRRFHQWLKKKNFHPQLSCVRKYQNFKTNTNIQRKTNRETDSRFLVSCFLIETQFLTSTTCQLHSSKSDFTIAVTRNRFDYKTVTEQSQKSQSSCMRGQAKLSQGRNWSKSRQGMPTNDTFFFFAFNGGL